jgi:Thymidylate kinase
MNRNDTALHLLTAAHSALAQAGIRHAVVHGLEGAPGAFGRDVDILIDGKREAEAIRLLEAEFTRHNIPWYRHYNPVGTQQFLFQISPGTDAAKGFEIDFLTRLHLRWGPVIFTDINDPTRPSNVVPGLPFSPWGSFAKRLLVKILAGHWKTLDRKRHDWRVEEEDLPVVRERLARFLGEALATRLLEILAKGDLGELQALQPKIRRELYKRAMKTPKGWWKWAAEEMAPFFRARQGAPIFALVGPDGVGKSTVINLLKERFLQQTCFPNVKIKHWRPGLLPQLGRLKCISAPAPGQATIPRKKAGSFGLLRQIYYLSDFLLGYWLVDRLESNRLTVQIYDRCLLDMTIHPVRFGFSNATAVRKFAMFCRRPDAVILLKDDPARIHARKDELPVEEISRQFASWDRLQKLGHIDLVVDVRNGPEEAANEIMNFLTSNLRPQARSFAEIPSLDPIQP